MPAGTEQPDHFGTLDPVRLPDTPGESCRLTLEELPGSGESREMFEASDGHVWIQRYAEGLTEFDGTRFHAHGEADGVGGYLITGLSEDPAGNLWLAWVGGISDVSGRSRKYQSPMRWIL